MSRRVTTDMMENQGLVLGKIAKSALKTHVDIKVRMMKMLVKNLDTGILTSKTRVTSNNISIFALESFPSISKNIDRY